MRQILRVTQLNEMDACLIVENCECTQTKNQTFLGAKQFSEFFFPLTFPIFR